MTIAPPAPVTTVTPIQPTSLLGRLARGILQHRKLVLIAWLIVLIAGGSAASHVSSRLSVDFSLPGQPGYRTGLRILQTYGNGGVNGSPSILVVTLPSGQTGTGRPSGDRHRHREGAIS